MSITAHIDEEEESNFSVDIIDIYLRVSDDLSEINLTYQLPMSMMVRSKKDPPAAALEYHQLNRPYDESVVRTINRLVINCKSKLSTASSKSKKVSKTSASHSKSTIRVPSSSSSPISCRIKHNSYDMTDADVYLLRVSDLKSDMLIYVDSFCFKVVRNYPSIVMLSTFPKKVLFCGCLIVPQVCLESADDFQCTWLCEDSPRSNIYVVVCTEKSFTPMLQHVGCRLKLLCNAVDSSCSGLPRIGRPVVSYLSGCVQHAAVFNRMLDIRRDYHLLPRDAMMDSYSCSRGSSSTTSRSSKEIRVVTYNILAEPYATSHQAINSLFRYCDKTYLDSEYRLQRSLNEILACDADVVCLQECDLKAYEAYLLPALGSRGYAGHYSDKSGREGCATFVLSRSYTILRTFDVSLKNILRTAPYLSFLYDLRPDLRDVIGGKLGTVCQLTLIRSVSMPHREVVVCNTHLFYHPFAGMIRLLQLFAITRMVEELLRDLSSSGPDGYAELTVAGADEENVQYVLKEQRLRQSLLSREAADAVDELSSTAQTEEVPVPLQRGVFIAGDLNSMPSTAAIEFLTTGCVSPALWMDEWNKLQDFRWGNSSPGEEELEEVQEAIASIQLVSITGRSAVVRSRTEEHRRSVDKSADVNRVTSHPWCNDLDSMRDMVTHRLGLINASGLPEYTNYTADFKDTLDYVMASQHCFQVIRVAPFPPESVLCEHIALPSEVFPSDHIAVAVDVEWMDMK